MTLYTSALTGPYEVSILGFSLISLGLYSCFLFTVFMQLDYTISCMVNCMVFAQSNGDKF